MSIIVEVKKHIIILYVKFSGSYAVIYKNKT